MDSKHEQFIHSIIRRYLSQGRVILFGSRARKTHYPGSDFDIALDTGKPIKALTLAKIRDDLEQSTIPFYVEVMDYWTLDEGMKEEIDKEGIVWNF